MSLVPPLWQTSPVSTCLAAQSQSYTLALQTVLQGPQGSVQSVVGRMPVSVESGSQLEIGGVPATVFFSSQVGAIMDARHQGHGLFASSPDAGSAVVGCLAPRLSVPPLCVKTQSLSAGCKAAKGPKLSSDSPPACLLGFTELLCCTRLQAAGTTEFD